MKFGTELRSARRRAGITQRDLAERAGLDFSYISKLENGRVPPPAADRLVVICQVLGVAPEHLLSLSGKIPNEVQNSISRSTDAQRFLLEAHSLGLTDEEWRQLGQSLKELRPGGD